MTTDQFEMADGDYVPDPEHDTALLIAGFFDHISATLQKQALPPGELVSAISAMRKRHAELEAANAHMVVDEASRYNLRITLAVVAAYEKLLPRLGRDAATRAVRDALVEPLGEAVHASTRAMLDAAPDPFRAMVDVSKAREEYAFGKTFTFQRSADDDQRYLLDIHRCFYHDVLTANSAAELTPVMCAFDGNWIEAIDPERHGFRFDRATTIGLGGATCPFHFTRTAP
ncbi:L-2-amino-thiazoline-4-carboxylic acid hydrolase [Streptomyces sp. NBS 14/10]|uniref:L-2-amino-thiazoline-4-carboxylic acid hydrolase n=1 Tax=Streptomyces sp. NBS 14/10 TaxID=1945643 RepID=UPI000B7E9004|nr:L-2-amino-thiazoline-4-carboxylic acid hydrolase [Streptomyces sp. NBS 14/10]KAK1179645.1 L-2-amino-thiazoline-4-carboxylic acid hydrolase [Streptomyces sp. NBS 14/10]